MQSPIWMKEASIRNSLEDVTASQLVELGFKVFRVPGKFNFINTVSAMNFFNMVTAETPDGKNIVVFLGCIDKEYEKFFMETMTQYCDRKIDNFYFLDLKASQESLSKFGGIACRTKTIPM